MRWGRGGNVAQEFGRDLPGGLRRQDDPLPRFPGRTSTAAPYEVRDDFEPLDEGEDATDDGQELVVRLPAAVLEWLEERTGDDMTLSDVLVLCVELQMPAGARVS